MIEKVLHLVGLFGHWGYLVIFLAAFLESSAFVGLLVPGESVVVVAGFLASQGILDLGDCLWLIALGAVLGDSVGYSFGKAIGRGYFERNRKLLLLKEKHIRKVDGYFERHGGKTVFFGRFVGVLRAMAPFVAGMSRMPYRKFALYNIAGGVIWAATFTILGYFFGRSWRLIEHWSGRAGVFILFLFLVLGAFAYLYKKIVSRQEQILGWFHYRYTLLVDNKRIKAFIVRHPEMTAFIKERLSPRGYLGLHLTIGLIVSAIFVWIFGGITEDILTGDPLVAVDRWVISHVLYFRTPFVTDFMRSVTFFGSGLTITIASMVVIGFLVLRKRFDYLIRYVVTIAGGSMLITLLKALIHRPRPLPESMLTQARGWSFPSGHVMMSVIFYGVLAYFIILALRSWRLQVFTGMLVAFLVFLVGLSSIYLQSHYLSDVIAGYVGGLFWLSVCITGLEVYRRAKSKEDVILSQAA
jgi:membrane protein DedA with SNARE-associated domain/membrane-associated phospholipid phosphatase